MPDSKKIAQEWMAIPGVHQMVAQLMRMERSYDGVTVDPYLGAERIVMTFLKAWLIDTHVEVASHAVAVSVLYDAKQIVEAR